MKHLLSLLKQKYDSAPQIIQHILFPISKLYYFTKEVYDTLKPHVWLINTNKNNENISLMYCGNYSEKNYLIRIIFLEECKQEDLGRIWVWKIHILVRKQREDVNLLVCNTLNSVSSWLGHRKCFCIPAWVQGDMVFSLIDFNSDNIKKDIARVFKNSYTFEIKKGLSQLEIFYNEMYKPYVTKRYDDESVLTSLKNIKRLSRHSELLLINRNGAHVAGCIFYYKNGKVIFSGIG